MELRRKKNLRPRYEYGTDMIIRVSSRKQAKFSVSKTIAEKLNMDIEKDALMFRLGKKISVFKEEIEVDNYKLRKADANTYRFVSTELHDWITGFFKVKRDVAFYIKMNDDFTFELV